MSYLIKDRAKLQNNWIFYELVEGSLLEQMY